MASKGNLDEEYSHYVKIALEKGASEVRVIQASSIKTAAWIRLRCQYGCPNYGTNLCCPPFSPTSEETQRVINEYSYAMVLKYRSSDDLRRTTTEIERALFLNGKYKAFSFKGGSCGLCEECNLKRCVHTDQARPSMEGSGIDVYETVRRSGFNIEVLKNRESQVSYFGLILIE